jgi:hypothetical protein
LKTNDLDIWAKKVQIFLNNQNIINQNSDFGMFKTSKNNEIELCEAFLKSYDKVKKEEAQSLSTVDVRNESKNKFEQLLCNHKLIEAILNTEIEYENIYNKVQSIKNIRSFAEKVAEVQTDRTGTPLELNIREACGHILNNPPYSNIANANAKLLYTNLLPALILSRQYSFAFDQILTEFGLKPPSEHNPNCTIT